MRLGNPDGLWFVVIPALALLAYVYGYLVRRQLAQRLGHLPLVRTLTNSLSSERRLLKQSIVMIAIILLVGAILRPQYGRRPETIRKSGIDMAIAFDISKSMLARDVYPGRLTAARTQLAQLMDRLAGDRLALVPFAGIAFTQSPLTADQGAIRLYLDSLDPKQMPVGGTNLAMAISESVRLLTGAQDRGDRSSRSRVILLITDGEDVSDDQGEAAREAARKAAEEGIKIFAIAIGTRLGEPIPILNEDGTHGGYQKNRQGQPIYSKLNIEFLEELSRLADPATPDATKVFQFDGQSEVIDGLVTALDTLQKTVLKAGLRHSYGEKFQFLLLPAILLLMLELVISERRRRKVGTGGDRR